MVTFECEACKGLWTKRVTNWKDYTKHECCHATTPFAFDSGELLRWDNLSCAFVHYGTHKCDHDVGQLPRIPQKPYFPLSQDEHADDDEDGQNLGSLSADSSAHDNGKDEDSRAGRRC